MTFSIKDFATQLAVYLKATTIGSAEVPHAIIASPTDGEALFRDGLFDASGRLRTSLPVAMQELENFRYGVDSRVWDSSLSSSGTVSANAAESASTLSTGATTSGRSCIFQTKRYFRYRAGRAHSVGIGFSFGTAVVNAIRRVGLFDANNGVFLEQNGTTDVALVVRTKVSGSVVDNRVVQANWNVDKLNGSGISTKTLDLTKIQWIIVDFQWIGSIRFGFVIEGKYYPAHVQHFANNSAVAPMVSPHLPIRYSVENNGVAGSTATVGAYGGIVFSEGAMLEPPPEQYASGNAVTTITVTTRRPIFSLRPATSFNSLTFKGFLKALAWQGYVSGGDALFELVVGGTLTGASFAAVDTNISAAEVDVAATAISGGQVLDAGYQGASQNGLMRRLIADDAIELNADDSQTGQLYSVVATKITGTAACAGAITWGEFK